mmetsp:Transcript_849/g.1326  ORF Transcript_849/g.1326 Transcript_849/m.1326 type:complete len:258 (-) Transcript_849:307-1080(-)
MVSSPRRPNAVGTPTHVSEPAFEFLLHAMIEQVEIQCLREYNKKMKMMKDRSSNDSDNNKDARPGEKKGEGKGEDQNQEDDTKEKEEEVDEKDKQFEQELLKEEEHKQQILMNENIAAKMERMGFDVGFRLVERLAQSKSLVPPTAHTQTPSQTLLQLEAVKFICKEFWTEVFRKQIDKLQTNHRGVFVLKDGSFKWLERMPSNIEVARAMAIKILALPCGLIRGALSNLGIAAVVSCDFMDDGEKMNSCSFNVKIK